MPGFDPDRTGKEEEPQGPPPGVDPRTGEITDPDKLAQHIGPEPTPPASLRAISRARPPGTSGAENAYPKLDTMEAVVAEINRELRKMELIGDHIIAKRQEFDGYYTDAGNFVAGVAFEYQEEFDTQIRKLYANCHDPEVPKDKRPKWPGEDVRESLVNEYVTKELRQRRAALKADIDSLREFRMLTQSRLNGLQSVLGYRKEQAKLDAYNPTGR